MVAPKLRQPRAHLCHLPVDPHDRAIVGWVGAGSLLRAPERLAAAPPAERRDCVAGR